MVDLGDLSRIILCCLLIMRISNTDSPTSWVHVLEDLNLLPDQTTNKQDPHHEVSIEKEFDECMSDFNTSSGCVTTDSGIERSPTAATVSYTRKPLIHPARLQVRKRRFSISSATAALSLTGDGCGFSNHVTSKRMLNGEAPNPFQHVSDARWQMNRRYSYIVEERNNHFRHREVNRRNGWCSSSGNGLRISLRDSHNKSSSTGLTLSNLAATAAPITHIPRITSLHRQSSLISSHLPCPCNQPQSIAGIPAAAPTSNKSLPPQWHKWIKCFVCVLILLSITANVVLLLVMFADVYRPMYM